MRTIWKFPFEVDDILEIAMPKGAEVLHVDAQNDQPCIWAMVNSDEPMEDRRFLLFGTGLVVPHMKIMHLGSFQMRGGRLVFHLFMEG